MRGMVEGPFKNGYIEKPPDISHPGRVKPDVGVWSQGKRPSWKGGVGLSTAHVLRLGKEKRGWSEQMELWTAKNSGWQELRHLQ